MRGYFTMSEDEKNSILQQHSGFYNGYSTGNIPSTPQPLQVSNGPSDKDGITVNNRGEVKTYRNHLVNESKKKQETKEIEDTDTNYSELDPSYDYESGGPKQFQPDMDDNSPYDSDIESIQNMFDFDDIYSDDDDIDIDMLELQHNMDSEFSGKEKLSGEKDPYDFESDGGDVDVFGEEEQCEGCNSEIEEITSSELVKGKKYRYKSPTHVDDIEFEDEYSDIESDPMYQFKGEDTGYSLNPKAIEDFIEDNDDEMMESIKKERQRIIEMFDRFKKFN